jgi:chitooligosaccharide synthase NodC
MTSVGIRFLLDGLRLLFALYGVVAVSHFLLQSLFAHLAWRRSLRQRSGGAEPSPFQPSVDVIVACYNEDPERLDACCRSVLDQDYRGAMRVYLVDDGSGNRESLVPVYDRYSGRPGWRALLPDENAGKRHAQDLAVRFSSGELLVTIDSDTQIAPDSIRTIVAAFRDERVGAVTGNVGVSNAKVNLLTRLIDLRYWVAFNQERAAQGFFGSVLCCSGPFAVYRRNALTDLWRQYISQTFRGVRCTYGDDRHLTNLVLQRGYLTLYEPRALATTNVPTTLREYLHQQLRWNKSFYRELLWTFTFVHRRPAYLIFEVSTQTMLPVLLVLAVASALYSSLLVHPGYLLRYIAMIAVMGLMHCLYGAYRTRNLAFVLFVLYGFLHAALLIPLRVRALSSLTDNRWGTRTIPPGGAGRGAGRPRLSALGRQPPAGPCAAAPGPRSPIEG